MHMMTVYIFRNFNFGVNENKLSRTNEQRDTTKYTFKLKMRLLFSTNNSVKVLKITCQINNSIR